MSPSVISSDESPTSKPTFWSSKKAIPFEDYLELNECAFNWVDSYEVNVTAPTSTRWETINADDSMAIMTDQGFLSDVTERTQHLLVMICWERVGNRSHRQPPTAFYIDATLTTVKTSGHSHATKGHCYVKIDGAWKFTGLNAKARWNEHD
ncbi:putative scytalone dehydratase [Calycina marina]|uniref:Scytalone dehydratase n=1 Tax=Calycina marina TaxID=1763456 RepID=A0A9P7Z3Z1_9HELO|nr:putative scytalone dehydratase [Calycina marina]